MAQGDPLRGSPRIFGAVWTVPVAITHLCFVTQITQRAPARARRAGTRRTRDITQSVAAVRRIMRILRVAEQRTQQETGVSAAQLLVLQHLGDSGALSLTELADRTSTDRSSVTDVVERLVEQRLARRVRDPEDGRRACISMTARGRAILRRAAQSPAAILVAGLRGLSPSQLTAVGRSLDRLSRALDAHNGAS